MVFGPGDRLYVADWRAHSIIAIDRLTCSSRVHVRQPAMNQPNDLAICSDGTLFASDPDWDSGTGQLWRVAPDGDCTLMESGMGTTNGIEVSPDERTLYVNESVQRRIWAYDLGPDKTLSGKRSFIQFDDFLLDGMRCDQQGGLYVTRTGAGVVVMLSADGAHLGEIRLQGRDCTNVTFGGLDGRSLYVTVSETGCIEHVRVPVAGRSHLLQKTWLGENASPTIGQGPPHPPAST